MLYQSMEGCPKFIYHSPTLSLAASNRTRGSSPLVRGRNLSRPLLSGLESILTTPDGHDSHNPGASQKIWNSGQVLRLAQELYAYLSADAGASDPEHLWS